MSTQPDPIEAFRAVAAIFGAYATERLHAGSDASPPNLRVALTLHDMAVCLVDLTCRRGCPVGFVDQIKRGLERISALHPSAVGRSRDLAELFPRAIRELAEVDGAHRPSPLRSTMAHGPAGVAGRFRDYLDSLAAALRDRDLAEVLRASGRKLTSEASLVARDIDPGLYAMRDLLAELRAIRLVVAPSVRVAE